jgi:hypothetical protein
LLDDSIVRHSIIGDDTKHVHAIGMISQVNLHEVVAVLLGLDELT